MALVNIKITLDSSKLESDSEQVVSKLEAVGEAAESNFGKAALSLSSADGGIESLKNSFDSLSTTIESPIAKIGEIGVVAERSIGKADSILAEFQSSFAGMRNQLDGLADNFDLPIQKFDQFGNTLATVADNGVQKVSGLKDSFSNMLSVIGGSVGIITIAGFALSTLIPIIAQAIDSESELAEERKKTAEETIKITEAEIKRVTQAAKTDKSIEDSTGKLRELNEQLIRQQLLLSDINLRTYREEMDDANDGVKSFVNEINRSTVTKVGIMRDMSATAIIARDLFAEFSGDVVKIQTEVEKRLQALIIEEGLNRKTLTEQEQFSINVRKGALDEINDKVKGAATAQKNYNSEIENQIRLIQALNTPDKGIAPPEIQTPDFPEAKPIVQPVELGEVRAKEIKLPSVGLEEFSAVQAEEIKMVDLKFQTHLSSEEQYLNDKRALLEQQATFMADFYGAESQQALEANLRKIQFDEEYTRKKQQLEQQAARNTMQMSSNLMANAQGVNEFLFGIGKGASLAQATVDTYAAANLALKTYPPPFGVIAAGVSIATGLLNVSKITATKFERKAEGGILGDGLRTVLAADFGGGENGLFIGNTDEFVVNAASTRANRALLELINASEGAVMMNTSRQNGGPIGSASSPSTGSGAAPLIDMTDVVQAIRDIKIEVRAELDAMHFYRQTLPDYEKEEARRRLA